MLIKLSTKLIKYLLAAMIIAIIVFALLINAARMLFPLLTHQRGRMETYASQSIHQPVTIGKVSVAWQGFDPVLALNNVSIHDAKTNQTVIHIHHITMGLDLFHTLWHRKILPSYFSISGLGLSIMQNKMGQFFIQGMPKSNLFFDNTGENSTLRESLMWLLTQGNVNVSQVSIKYQNSNGVVFPISHLQLNIANHDAIHAMQGKFNLKPVTQIHFLFQLKNLSIKNNQFDGKGYIKADHLLLHQYHQLKFFDRYLPVKNIQGLLSSKIWLTWKRGKLIRLQSLISGKKIAIYPREKAPMVIPILHTHLVWKSENNGWSLKANHFILHMAKNLNWDNKIWGYRVVVNPQTKERMHFFAINDFHLDDLSRLKNRLNDLPKNFRDLIFHLKPKGYLDQSLLAWQDDASGNTKISLSTNFKNMSIHAWKNIPKIQGVSGHLYYSPNKGLLNLNSSDASIDLPNVFSHSLDHLIIRANIIWYQQGDNIDVHMNHYFLSDHYLSTHGNALLTIPKNGKITINLLSSFHLSDARHVVDYMPKKILTPGLKKWMTGAFIKGSLTNGVLLLHGPLDKFPFDHHEGQFEIATNIHQMTMAYFPGWPEYKNINGIIHFEGRAMTAICQGGTVAGNPIHQVSAEIPDLQHTVLSIHAQSTSDLSFASNFLKHSPLAFGQALSVVKFQGPMKLDIHLKVTIRKKHSTVLSQGLISIDDGKMTWPTLDLVVNHVHGNLNFINANLSAKNISAKLYDSPMHLNMTSIDNGSEPSMIQIEVGGQIDTKKIRQMFPLPILHYVSGKTNYRGVLTINNGADQTGDNFSVASNLSGITIKGLPKRYNKSAKESRDFLFHVKLGSSHDLDMLLQYAHLFSTALEFNTDHQHFKLKSANLRFGSGSAEQENLSGIVIDGKLKTFNWNNWKAFLTKFLGNASHPSLLSSASLRYIELSIDHLKYKKLSLDDLYLKIIPHDTYWMVNLQSPKIAGIINIPKLKDKPWHIRLQHLYIPKLKKGKMNHFDFTQLPSLDLQINDFRYGKMDLGNIQLKTKRTKEGIIIDNLITQSPLLTAHISGQWQTKGRDHTTALHGILSSNNFGKFLLEQNLSNHLVGGKGTINFSLKWPGSPMQFNPKHLSGYVNTKCRNGSILLPNEKIGTELGLGRLINILSVQSLIRRLMFDFSDLTSKGLTFNTLESRFILDHGIAYTQYSYLSGPIAKVIVSGTINFVVQSDNLVLTIQPIVTSSLPFIVGIAGGPLAGAVTWVVNKMIGPGISRAVSSSYQIMGSWDRPIFIKLSKRKF